MPLQHSLCAKRCQQHPCISESSLAVQSRKGLAEQWPLALSGRAKLSCFLQVWVVWPEYSTPALAIQNPAVWRFKNYATDFFFLKYKGQQLGILLCQLAKLLQRFAAALLPLLFGTNPRSHHKGATGRILTGDQLLPVLYDCQLGQDIPKLSWFQVQCAVLAAACRIGAGPNVPGQ